MANGLLTYVRETCVCGGEGDLGGSHASVPISLFFFATHVTDSVDPLRAKSRRFISGVDHEGSSSSASSFSSFFLMTAALSTSLAESFVACFFGEMIGLFIFAMCMGTLAVTLTQ